VFLNDRRHLSCLVTSPLTEFLDFNAIEAVVDATHRYPEVFYPKEG
jgi:precorrin-6x reductase